DGDPHVFTSAGVTAGIDLALALVEADLGRSIALAVALDVHGGMAAQCVDVGPVGGGGPAVQQAGGRKNEG
ncbi:hypothetical protein R0G64_32340, partial [Pseudomonas otitidis]|nr:hypothetical protein [Pseudomonas otitidis]